MGWFRADSLEELVGLDISYHGGSASSRDGVKKEYVEAYKRHKGSIRQRRSGSVTADYGGWRHSGAGETASSINGGEDPESNQMAAATEGMRDVLEDESH